MLRGGEDSLTWKDSWFLGFKDSKFLQCFWKILVPCYQISISCFLIDIDLISKISKNFSNESSSFFGARLFQNWQKWISENLRFINIIFPKKVPGIFLDVLRYAGVSKDPPAPRRGATRLRGICWIFLLIPLLLWEHVTVLIFRCNEGMLQPWFFVFS